MKRLALFGALATPPFVALVGLKAGWWPLNIMVTLLVITAALYFVERGGAVRSPIAAGMVLVGGSSVEFWWPAVVMVLRSGATAKVRVGRPCWSRRWHALHSGR